MSGLSQVTVHAFRPDENATQIRLDINQGNVIFIVDFKDKSKPRSPWRTLAPDEARRVASILYGLADEAEKYR